MRISVDLLIVGGGIHGAGIARDAAGRALKVLLVEQGDLACGTSSASSKLAHGGLRYLELGDFRLVREALRERETLMRIAPHLVWPMPFFLSCGPHCRPAWQIRLGLRLYDWLAGRKQLPRSHPLDLSRSAEGECLQPQYRRGFCYYDGWADDARLVVANAVDAASRGALVMTRTRCVEARPQADGWSARLVLPEGMTTVVTARAIVNATGPWVEQFLRECTPVRAVVRARLIKGSHLVVRRRLPAGRALLLQNDDARVVFLIPFEDEFALLGTTDVPLVGNAMAAAISQSEIDYLCRAANRYLAQPVSEQEVAWSFSGVRALHDDGNTNPSRVTRDYRLQLDRAENDAPILSVYGGKLTTYRRLAEEALAKLSAILPTARAGWTAHAPLPGGDLGGLGVHTYAGALQARHPALPAAWVAAIVRRHGALAEALMRGARNTQDLGVQFGATLTSRELDYLVQHEWAREPSDVLWRRTKAGLHLASEQCQAIGDYLLAMAKREQDFSAQ